MRPYLMQFEGKTNKDFGALIYDYAIFGGGEKKYETTAIAGRVGEFVGFDKYKSNLKISIKFTLLGENITQKIRRLKEWLSGKGELKLSDSPETFYKVLKINYGGIQRKSRRYGIFAVSFLCIPYEFRKDGQIEYRADEIFSNPFSQCNPIYKIKGEGICKLEVNGNTMEADVGQNLTIDTNLMIAYREDGALQNTAIKGDYELMRFPAGEINISITSGFELKIIPNWGYDV